MTGGFELLVVVIGLCGRCGFAVGDVVELKLS